MRRIFAILVIIILLGLTACSSDEVVVEPTNDSAAEVSEPADTTDSTGTSDTTDTGDAGDTSDAADTSDTTDTTDTTGTDDSTDTAANETSTPAATGGHTIEIKEWTFEPKELTISVGDTVTWVNSKPEGQRNSNSQLWRVRGVCFELKSDDFAPGETYSYTFEEAGECNYRDIYHGNYAGEITVE